MSRPATITVTASGADPVFNLYVGPMVIRVERIVCAKESAWDYMKIWKSDTIPIKACISLDFGAGLQSLHVAETPEQIQAMIEGSDAP